MIIKKIIGLKNRKKEIKNMKQDNISPLIETMLKSAFYSDESELTDPYLNYLGLGKITYSKRVRNGIKDLINLMEENYC